MSILEEFNRLRDELGNIPNKFNLDAQNKSKEEQSELFKKYIQIQNDIHENMRTLANSYTTTEEDITPGWILVDAISSCLYHTQGFGAFHYARVHAQQIADKFNDQHIPSKIIEVKLKNGISDFQVWAKCSSDMSVLIKYKSANLEEQIKRIIKSGANPRVFYPFLPPEYEETIGIDHFGNKI